MSGSEYTGGRVPDLTMQQDVRGPGLMYGGYLYVRCGCKGPRKGGTWAGLVPMRCPKCTAERKAKKETA